MNIKKSKEKALVFIGEKREDGSVAVTTFPLSMFHYIVSSKEKDWMESKELDFIIREYCKRNNIELDGVIIRGELNNI